MFGQLCEPLPVRPGGAWLPWDGAVRVVVVPVPLLDVVVLLLDDAALATAAPPPTRAPVTTRVVSAGFSLRIVVHLLSSRATTMRPDRRSAVGAT